MRKSIAIILSLAMFACIFAGCTKKQSEETAQPEASTQVEEKDTWTFTDSAGREVEIPTNIERIIPSGALAQTFMWPLAADKLVSLNVAFTPEQLKYVGEQYANLPVTGNLYQTGSELNVEEVASLNVQIIIDFGEPKDTIVQDLDNLQKLLGIPCIFIEGSFQNSADAYRTLGKILNKETEAEELAVYIEDIMDTTADAFSKIDKKTLVFANSADGLGCIASGTYFDEIWAYMGENVAVVQDAQTYWFSTVGLEQLQTWDPEYIFFYSKEAYTAALADPAWSGLSAVKEDKCYTIPAYPVDFCFSPSVNRYMGIQWLATIMYPNDFDWDLKEAVTKYYKLFYDCNMTDDLYNELMGA